MAILRSNYLVKMFILISLQPTYKNLLDFAWLNSFLSFWVLYCEISATRCLNRMFFKRVFTVSLKHFPLSVRERELRLIRHASAVQNSFVIGFNRNTTSIQTSCQGRILLSQRKHFQKHVPIIYEFSSTRHQHYI